MNGTEKCKMLKDMIRIRVFETELKKLVEAGEMTGFIHFYLGEEAIAVGVCNALNSDDYIASTHRGHGHLIAKGVNTRDMMAELFGKASGCNKGKGGSMHICVPSLGIVGSNGIVGAGLPLATGAALSAKYCKNGRVSVCFFGDGASNEGAFHESINMAAAWKLPAIFVCENNLYACNTRISTVTNTPDIADRAKGYNIPGVVVDGNDVEAVNAAMEEAVKRARAGEGPTLLECKTYRHTVHCYGDPDLRTPEELQYWMNRDPIKLYSEKLLAEKVLDQAEIDSYWVAANEEVAEAIEYGKSEPEPELSALMENVYSE